ncbi:hypothetical protein Tco_0703385 [Tanacetum coccineum]|uniref:Uncharacterized protein n=1 Tax=Tanacetum coccineum TaxID=301880 RepID=A0ABQ4XYS0_9ASTR
MTKFAKDQQKYGVTPHVSLHRVSSTNKWASQVTNRGLKRILEKETIGENRACLVVDKLYDAYGPSAQLTKRPSGVLLNKAVYERHAHLPESKSLSTKPIGP